MQRICTLVGLVAVGAQRTCHSVSASVDDGWCTSNCNHKPSNCPADLCQCDDGPTPPPTPVPPTPPSPPSPPSPLPSEIVGYYAWNWGAGSRGPAAANSGVAFTGLIDVDGAISGFSLSSLRGTKYISLGGGNAAGVFTANSLKQIAASAGKIKQAGYEAVMFDVEEVSGNHATMVPLFNNAFAALRQSGLIVAVTTSHSAPYQCDTAQDAVEILKAWVDNDHIDILSPQLYSSGMEGSPEFAETNSCKDAGCTWDLYKNSKAVFAPSIVDASQYGAVQSWFSSNYGITTRGYFQWAQTASQDVVV